MASSELGITPDDTKASVKTGDNGLEAPPKQPFFMPIEDVFSIPGRGIVCTGNVERGMIKKDAKVELVGFGGSFKANIREIELFDKERERGEAGDNVGVLLCDVKREQAKRGQVLCAPGSVKSVQKFKAQVLSKDEGGWATHFRNHLQARLFIRTADVRVGLSFPPGTENPDEKMVTPGNDVELIGDLVHDVAMEKGSRFVLCEEGKTIGTGTVTEIYE